MMRATTGLLMGVARVASLLLLAAALAAVPASDGFARGGGPGGDGPGAGGPGAGGPGAGGPDSGEAGGRDGPGIDGPGIDGPGIDGPGIDGPGTGGPQSEGSGRGGPGAGQSVGPGIGPGSGPGSGPGAAAGRGAAPGRGQAVGPGRGPAGGGRGPSVESETVAAFASADVIEAAEALGAISATSSLPGLGLTITRFRSPDPETDLAVRALLGQAQPAGSFGDNHFYEPMAIPVDADRMAGWIATVPSINCRQGTPVGIVDTGVAVPPAGISLTRAHFPFMRGAPAVSDGHGQVIADLIAVMGEPRIYAANAFAFDVKGRARATAVTLVQSLDWLMQQPVEIINLSLAGPHNLLLELALGRIAEFGVTVVAAAGNSGPLAGPAFPAAYPSTIAVAAYGPGGAPFPYGNQGDYIDLSAPGMALETGDPDRSAGTSLAAALVSGTLSSSMASGQDESRRWLIAQLVDQGPSGPDPIFGYGALTQLPRCSR